MDPAQPRTNPMSPVASGASAELFAMEEGQERGQGPRVLKLFRASVSDEMIAREAAASVHAGACGVPTAAAIGRHDRDGRRGLVYPRLDGTTLMAWIRKHPLRAAQAIDAMARLHAVMHHAPGGELRSLQQVLATDIAYGPAPRALQQAATAYLDTLPDGDTLTHGDLHLGNVMMTPKGLMVIDWSKAARGHPAADAVRSEMLMRFGAGPHDWITNLWRDWAARRLRRTYLSATTPVSAADMARWRPVVALAWLRARDAGRTPAFRRYLARALAGAGIRED
ncbi:phosphotransferase family protein [Sphingobium sp. TCM1]|uniref:phosphotransferase family protein n=1 Tax=Sphingobium sp. TCM1 TaxID=453246 RepID=UPI0007F3724B|nr:aminoglycoside phosphotransferase family protein [Sphingobium sp. TCM1]OAN54310.1 aminoglycoside phosphotransferase (protein kinase related), diverged [Sphingobium sp. TCM1]